MPTRALFLGALICLLSAPAALADPAGRSTTDETIRPDGSDAFTTLRTAGGERHRVRRPAGVRADRNRARTRRSLAFFGQLTDPQIADEMSPARVDFVDPAGDATSRVVAAAGGARAAGVRPDRAQRERQPHESRRAPGGKRAKLGFAITTGDLADNQQLNETRWFKAVLDGGPVDPFSGKPISAANPCPGASAETVAALNADGRRPPVHRRRRLRRLPRRPR